MATGDVYAIKLHMTFAGQQCRPGFYLVEGTGFGGDPNLTRMAANAVQTTLGADALAGFSAALSWDATEAQQVQPGTARSWVLGNSPVFVGDVADDNPVPPQDSMLIEWLSDLKGGKGKYARRGRTYMPGIYSTGQVSGFLIEDLQNALSAFASLLFDAFVTDGTQYQLQLVSFTPNSNPRTIRESHPVVAFNVDNVVDIIRRRRPGRGI
jgi:hypothetical protein